MSNKTAKDEATAISSLFLRRLNALKKEPAISRNDFLISGLYENSAWVFICSEHKDVRLKDEDEAREHLKQTHSTRAKLGIT